MSIKGQYEVYSKKYSDNVPYEDKIKAHMAKVVSRHKKEDEMNSDILYDAEFTLEDDIVRDGLKLWYKKGHRIFNYGTLTLAIMSLIPAILYFSVQSPTMSIFFFFASVMFFLFYFKGYIFATDTEIKALHKLFETEENCGRFHIKFYEDQFEQITKISTKKIMYSDIKSVYENNNVIIIFTYNKNLFFVVKSGISENSDNLYDFLDKIVNNKETK